MSDKASDDEASEEESEKESEEESDEESDEEESDGDEESDDEEEGSDDDDDDSDGSDSTAGSDEDDGKDDKEEEEEEEENLLSASLRISCISADLESVTKHLCDVFHVDRSLISGTDKHQAIPPPPIPLITTPTIPPALKPSTTSFWRGSSSSFSNQFIRSCKKHGDQLSPRSPSPVSSHTISNHIDLSPHILKKPLAAKDLYQYQIDPPVAPPAPLSSTRRPAPIPLPATPMPASTPLHSRSSSTRSDMSARAANLPDDTRRPTFI